MAAEAVVVIPITIPFSNDRSIGHALLLNTLNPALPGLSPGHSNRTYVRLPPLPFLFFETCHPPVMLVFPDMELINSAYCDSAIRPTLPNPGVSAQSMWLSYVISTHGEHLLRVKRVNNITGTLGPVVIGVRRIFHESAHLPA